MAYFNELPNLEVVSRFSRTKTNQDYLKIKNIWKRPKLREDVANAVTAFEYYQIKDGERPDQIAEKYYGDPELDWVILITNNILNFNNDWPLDNNSFYNYLIEKYGSDEELQKIHHVETTEGKDEFNRLILPKGLIVDKDELSPDAFTTSSTETILSAFTTKDNLTEVTVNLLQALNVKHNSEGDILYPIDDIREEVSFLKVYKRDSTVVDIQVNNDLVNNWPSGWGGALPVLTRNSILEVPVEDKLNTELNLTTRINISEKLYDVGTTIVDGQELPTFIFRVS